MFKVVRSLLLFHSCLGGILVNLQAFAFPVIGPHISSRVVPGDPLYLTGKYCENPKSGPDQDLTGLGVRVGLYLQCVALSLATVTGLGRLLTALPASIMTVLVVNIILTMKATQTIFGANPVIQDFWVAQVQLFLLTSIVPFTMLFGQWTPLGSTKNILAPLAVLYPYTQALWFWLAGYLKSDEIVCDTLESKLGSWELFSRHARWGIIVLYLFGFFVMFPLAVKNHVR